MDCNAPFQERVNDSIQRKIYVIEGNLTRNNLRNSSFRYYKGPTKQRLEKELKYLRGLL